MNAKNVNAFTLVELLIVISIIGILAGIATIVLNPSELTNRARDGKRISEIRSVHDTLALYEVDGGSSFGSTNTVYISLSDNASSTCGSHALPALPGGWLYNCVTDANLRNIDGTGWIPVNFAGISAGPPITRLPIDSINTAEGELYYTYVRGSWELNAVMQSVRQLSTAQNDGGDNATKFEIGTNLTITP